MRDKEILKNIQVCSKCIYDITVPSIKFDEQGICNYWQIYDNLKFYLDNFHLAQAKANIGTT